ncbi:MAG: agmatine deiminase family protein [Thioalkalivibrio sp.]|nr:MAG: agmatine deiminase family protein [Thioalkalivibrio sp.]
MSPAPSAARRLPAEWEPQSGVQITWPHTGTDWGPRLDTVEPVFAGIGAAITRHECLLVVCQGPDHRSHVLDQLARSGAAMERVRIGTAPADDTWARDHGPITVIRDGQPLLLDFVFNGWGGKFPSDQDNRLTRQLATQGHFGRVPLEPVDMVLEGGSIESDGAGTLLTTSRCLLTPTRNPGLSRATIEQHLHSDLGARRVLWLEHGHLEGDDTDSHIDTLARFCDPATIAHVTCEDPGDPHYAELALMVEELGRLQTAQGEPYALVPLPLPAAIFADGQRLPATYANFLVINDAVLVPVYGDPADAVALERLGAAFPGRTVTGIDCRELIRQGGSLHCLTMQFPRGVLAP